MLMDRRTPKMDSLETARKIRELVIITPIMALTASVLVGAKDDMLAIRYE